MQPITLLFSQQHPHFSQVIFQSNEDGRAEAIFTCKSALINEDFYYEMRGLMIFNSLDSKDKFKFQMTCKTDTTLTFTGNIRQLVNFLYEYGDSLVTGKLDKQFMNQLKDHDLPEIGQFLNKSCQYKQINKPGFEQKMDEQLIGSAPVRSTLSH